MTQLNYTWPLTPGTTEDFNLVNQNLQDIRTVVNGGLDTDNLSASAGIKDTQLASPNNAAYRTLAAFAPTHQGITTGTAVLTNLVGQLTSSGYSAAVGNGMFHLDPADYAVAGKTTKYRVKVAIATNTTAPTSTFTYGLYPVSSVAGGANQVAPTFGTVTAGSTVAFAAPAASTQAQGNSGDFTAPAAGFYAPGVAVTVAGQVANSAVAVHWMLQIRQV